LGVRFAVACQGETSSAVAELQLGEAYKFFPTNEALAAWRVQAGQGTSAIVYD
jgi:DNA polymerase-3 subunit alpha